MGSLARGWSLSDGLHVEKVDSHTHTYTDDIFQRLIKAFTHYIESLEEEREEQNGLWRIGCFFVVNTMSSTQPATLGERENPLRSCSVILWRCFFWKFAWVNWVVMLSYTMEANSLLQTVPSAFCGIYSKLFIHVLLCTFHVLPIPMAQSNEHVALIQQPECVANTSSLSTV